MQNFRDFHISPRINQLSNFLKTCGKCNLLSILNVFHYPIICLYPPLIFDFNFSIIILNSDDVSVKN